MQGSQLPHLPMSIGHRSSALPARALTTAGLEEPPVSLHQDLRTGNHPGQVNPLFRLGEPRHSQNVDFFTGLIRDDIKESSTLNITNVTAYPLSSPPQTPFAYSQKRVRKRTALLIKIDTDMLIRNAP
jgi:hypothetical protein